MRVCVTGREEVCASVCDRDRRRGGAGVVDVISAPIADRGCARAGDRRRASAAAGRERGTVEGG